MFLLKQLLNTRKDMPSRAEEREKKLVQQLKKNI